MTYRDHPRRAIRLSRLCAVLTTLVAGTLALATTVPATAEETVIARGPIETLATSSAPTIEPSPSSIPSQAPASPPSPASVPGTAIEASSTGAASISGRVTFDDGRPVSFGYVAASLKGSYDAAAYVYSSEDGTYRIEGLLAGTYTLTFSPNLRQPHR